MSAKRPALRLQKLRDLRRIEVPLPRLIDQRTTRIDLSPATSITSTAAAKSTGSMARGTGITNNDDARPGPIGDRSRANCRTFVPRLEQDLSTMGATSRRAIPKKGGNCPSGASTGCVALSGYMDVGSESANRAGYAATASFFSCSSFGRQPWIGFLDLEPPFHAGPAVWPADSTIVVRD